MDLLTDTRGNKTDYVSFKDTNVFSNTETLLWAREKKIDFLDSTINHLGKQLWSKNSVNFERIAEHSIHLACLPQREPRSLSPPHRFVSFFSCPVTAN